jgi:hypothetical protein
MIFPSTVAKSFIITPVSQDNFTDISLIPSLFYHTSLRDVEL